MGLSPNSVGTLFDKDNTRIEEILSKQIDTILPTLDPIWRDTVVSSQGVGPISEFSKDFQVNKLYRTGMTGVIEQGGPANDFVLYGDDYDAAGASASAIGNRLLRQKTPVGQFPDPLDGAKPKTFRLTVPMRSMYTNLSLTLGEMQMDATPAVIGDVVAPILQGFAQNMSHTLCNYWYLSQNDSYRLGTNASGTVAATGSGPYYWTISTTEQAYDRFFTGQRVDVYNGTARQNMTGGTTYIPTYVDRVDDLTGTVTFVADTDWGDFSSGDYIVYANSGNLRGDAAGTAGSFTGIAGVNSWLKSNGTLLGTESISGAQIDVDTHPEFKSMLKTNVGVLTEHKLRQYLRRFHVAKAKLGQTIDSLVASDGVWLSYEAQKIGQYQIERTGNLSNLKNEGSQEGFAFTFEGRTYKGHTSNYVERETVYGWKTSGNNWKRYVPPDYAGLQNMSEADSFVPFRFVVPALTGLSSVKWPYQIAGSNLLTEAIQMPGMLRMQLIPDQPAGLKLTGVTEDRVYADD